MIYSGSTPPMKPGHYSILEFYRRHTVLCNSLLIAGWLVVNLWQALFTELANDEAYYWMYSRNLDYGYFDHPPAIAVLIKLGCLVFQNELGVRILTVLLSTAFLWMTYLLTNRRNFPLFFEIFCSMSIFQAYGFIAVPDAPLLFFTACFYLFYRRYLANENVVNVFVLSMTIAALMYCKYHGLLILFFTMLSNLSLFKRRSLYWIIGLSLLAYLPHIWWQVSHDYPSYQYHVLTKSQDPYKPLDTLNFILGQLLTAGPVIGFLLFYAAFRYRISDDFGRALKFSLYGILLFFLFSTLNAPVEPNWTVISFVPLIVLGYNYITQHTMIEKWTVRFTCFSFVLFLFVRVNLVFDIFPEAGSKAVPEFYGWKTWAVEIRSKAGNTPVVFTNSYQKASKYTFYTGNTGFSLNNIRYRRNQYDLWDIEDSLQGKRVLYIPNWAIAGDDVQLLQTSKETISYLFIDNFRSYSKVAVSVPQPRYTFPAGKLVSIPIVLKNNSGYPVTFDRDALYPDFLVYSLFKEEDFMYEQPVESLKGLILDQPFSKKLLFKTPSEPGTYYLYISIKHGWLPPAINSRLIRINIGKVS